ncbi:Uu.00g140430.m01.CDS01 [Anthostomella pinea]|uniref:Uu.00g140430.m01.CDS01 n=1 Tax=Anthostomella pinea TaxID=933095 RepID=A0AAI8YLC6_9PEZI|nr:Uu.00g140430.m01.CDS01 [Anthostomella pinea]
MGPSAKPTSPGQPSTPSRQTVKEKVLSLFGKKDKLKDYQSYGPEGPRYGPGDRGRAIGKDGKVEIDPMP